mmetsp:Transcript_94325/g.304603  ORF Transcript_94325/g.304603 Transcript_94325/m.304603 type:complete len:356 (-) Transcript_94325:195-1262(-)
MFRPDCGLVRTKFSLGLRNTLACVASASSSRFASLSGKLRSTSSMAIQRWILGYRESHFLISLQRFSRKDVCSALITPRVAWSMSGVSPYRAGILYSSRAPAMPCFSTASLRQSEESTSRAPVLWTMCLKARMAVGQKSMPAFASLLPSNGTREPLISIVRACWNASCLPWTGRSTPSTSRKSTFVGLSSGGGKGSKRMAFAPTSARGVHSVLAASGNPSYREARLPASAPPSDSGSIASAASLPFPLPPLLLVLLSRRRRFAGATAGSPPAPLGVGLKTKFSAFGPEPKEAARPSVHLAGSWGARRLPPRNVPWVLRRSTRNFRPSASCNKAACNREARSPRNRTSELSPLPMV